MSDGRDFTMLWWSADLPRVGDGPTGHALANDLSPQGLSRVSWALCECGWLSENYKSKMAPARSWTAHAEAAVGVYLEVLGEQEDGLRYCEPSDTFGGQTNAAPATNEGSAEQTLDGEGE